MHARTAKQGGPAVPVPAPQLAKGAHLGAVDRRGPRTARPADLLCRGRGNRRCACWQSDPRRLASALALSLALAEQPPVRTSASLLDGMTSGRAVSPPCPSVVHKHSTGAPNPAAPHFHSGLRFRNRLEGAAAGRSRL